MNAVWPKQKSFKEQMETPKDENIKFCPLIAIARVYDQTCNEECAWHKDGKCAVVVIAEGFSLVEQGIYGAIPWAGCKHEL